MTGEEAERYLLSLELFGMRFGLERMRRLMTALGHPEREFRSVHVVGTNGKSSTTRMLAAILTAHGHRTGAYVSPHLRSYAERILVDGVALPPERFAAAIGRARHAARLVDRSAAADDPVTQFEALTAAAYSELAAAEVELAVIEAGLGGRFDATNVIPSEVQVLTSVGLEHTRWLGPTVSHIAEEKLDVVQPGGALVLGPALHPDARAVAERVAAERGARILTAPADPGVPVGAPGAFQRRNLAVAATAARALLGELDPEALARAAAAVRVPGRLQAIDVDPVTVLDGAHNLDGMRALAESVPELDGAGAGGRTVALVSILDDKDAAGMLATLGAVVDGFVFTRTASPRALSPATLASLARQVGAPEGEIVGDPRAGLERARVLAGPTGRVLAAGSLTLAADLLDDPARVAEAR